MAAELIDEIITLIRSESNNNPAPKPCKIVKTYGNEPYSDVEVENLGILIHRKTIGTPEVGLEGILCFLNGDLDQGIVITDFKIDIYDVYEFLNQLDENKSDISHTHGNLKSNGTMTSTYGSNCNYFVGLDANNKLWKANKLYSSKIINSSSLSNIGTSSGASQSTINSSIDTKLANKADQSHSHTIGDIYDWLDKVYPIGAIYLSVSDVNPSVLFGGSWEKIEDCFLLSSGSKSVNTTGGEENHTLSINEMPSHTHIQNAHSHRPSNNSNFLTSNDNIAINGDKRAWASKVSSGGTHYAYSSGTSGIDEPGYTNSVAATNQNTGGGQAHNNMPPYLVVNIWKRIE